MVEGRRAIPHHLQCLGALRPRKEAAMSPSSPGQQVVLVTGASSGIGEAIAGHLAVCGWRVFGTSRQQSAGPKGVEMLPMDVDQDDSVFNGIAGLVEKTGRLDAVVNNAGWALMGPIE